MLLTGNDEFAVLRDAVGKSLGKALAHVVGNTVAVGDIPAHDRFAVDLVDVLPARSAAACIAKLDFGKWDLDMRGDVQI